jgi:HD-GYP domain-containing protein (c-di-GMP phosphodiesterase class II)
MPERIVRVAELAGALSLASDLGHGAPREHGLRVALVTVRLGSAAQVGEPALQDAYFAALLRWAGCTATGPVLATWFGDDLAAHKRAQQFDGPLDPLVAMLSVGAGRGLIPRLRMLVGALAAGPGAVFGEQCEAAVDLAARLGCGEDCARSLGEVFERWDGKGWPGVLKGDELQVSARLSAIADDADMAHCLSGLEAARALVRRRAGKVYDPALAAVFDDVTGELWDDGDHASVWTAAMSAEPGAPRVLTGAALDCAFEVFADFADLKCAWFTGHSRSVATLAAIGARTLGLPDADCVALERAGLLHDLGRVAVSNEVWNRAGPLTADDREAVRLHPYHTCRITEAAGALREPGALAGLHHERLDGSGYPGGQRAEALSPAARLLAAADVVRALREPRPHRPALDEQAATEVLRGEVRAGRLDADAVAAIRDGRRGRRVVWPADLTAREVEVLRLLSRGCSNRQIAEQLVVSPRTVGHHVAHVYQKAGVSTRAGATLFAMRHGLLDLDATAER